MTFAPGTRVGSYHVLTLLGSGGMGDVYRAHDTRLEREVAIKTVRAPADHPDARARLWREARTAASINHPAICQVYDVGELDDAIYVVMELLEGQPLNERLADGPLPAAEAVHVALAMLGALHALHRRDLVHRDIKPSNVFLVENGIKLLDFGMARSFASFPAQADVTQTGTIVGTPRYMAPEQWTGAGPDPRTDLFATALVLFEMLTGQPAITGRDVMEIYHAVMSGQPPALSGSPAVVAIDGVIHRALEKRPEDRYSNAEEMAQALRTALAYGGDTPPTPVRRTTRLVVLPFRMLHSDPELDLLSFGLPDAIVSSLTALPSLVVRSPLAGTKYAGDSLDLKRIATELGVDWVVCGTLIRAGDQVRVSVQMLEVPAGTVRCSKTVQRPAGDIFAIQDQIAGAIVDALSIPLVGGEMRQMRRDRPASAHAYELYLRANHISWDTSTLPIAEELYRSALDEDPSFAPAWARLGRVYRLLAKYGPSEHIDDNLRRAADAFARALDLDPDSPAAHNLYTNFEVESLGRAKEATVRLVERLRNRAPDPELFAGLVLSCRFCGLLDASLAADRQARRIDHAIRTSVMYTHFMRGDWERAMASDIEEARWVTKYALQMVGREEEALAGYRALQGRRLAPAVQNMLRFSHAALEHRREDCVAEVRAFTAGRTFDPEGLYFAVRALARVDEPSYAMDLLDEIVERGFYCVPILLRDPWLDPVRAMSRFGTIVMMADSRSREADLEFRRVGGDRLLGM